MYPWPGIIVLGNILHRGISCLKCQDQYVTAILKKKKIEMLSSADSDKQLLLFQASGGVNDSTEKSVSWFLPPGCQPGRLKQACKRLCREAAAT